MQFEFPPKLCWMEPIGVGLPRLRPLFPVLFPTIAKMTPLLMTVLGFAVPIPILVIATLIMIHLILRSRYDFLCSRRLAQCTVNNANRK